MLKHILTVTLLIIIIGCATTAKYEEVLASWLGSDIQELVDSWGYPENSFDAPNGNKVYVYKERRSIYLPGETTVTNQVVGDSVYSTANTSAGISINRHCSTYFEINTSGEIVKWSYKGNECVSYKGVEE